MTKREALTYLRDYAKGYCDKNGEKIPPHSFDLNRETTDILEDAIIASMKQGRWYAVAKEMPEPGDWGVSVLVYTVDHEYHVWNAMPHRADNYCWDDEEGYCHDKWEAELWMPLPEV